MDNSKIEELLFACQEGNLERIKYFIEVENISPNNYYISEGNKIYPLHVLSTWPFYQKDSTIQMRKYMQCAFYLISKGASLDEIIISSSNISIRENLKMFNPQFLEACEWMENMVDPLNLKQPESE